MIVVSKKALNNYKTTNLNLLNCHVRVIIKSQCLFKTLDKK